MGKKHRDKDGRKPGRGADKAEPPSKADKKAPPKTASGQRREVEPAGPAPASPSGTVKTEPSADERPRFKLKARKRPAGSERFRDELKEIAVFDPENVEKVLEAMPPAEAIARMADRLQGLAHPTRVQTLLALSTSELCVGDVAAVLNLSLSATSTMLKQLRNLGFVSTRHAGKQTYYRLASPLPAGVFDVLVKLDQAAGPPTA
jgi:ArsR family transcriptional regulator